MALTIPNLLHSFYGRKLGVDHAGFVVGPPGSRHPYESLSTGALANSGVSFLESTAAANYTLADPDRVGIEKTIVNNSTFANTVTRAGASFFGSTGTSPLGVKITFTLPGAAVTLIAASTSRWVPKGQAYLGSTAYCSVSTSS